MGITREELEYRRYRVRTLLLCGASIRKIARELNITPSAAQRDAEAVLKELRREQSASDLEAARARSLAVFRHVQQNAWGVISRLDAADRLDAERLNAAELREGLHQFQRGARKRQQDDEQKDSAEDESEKLSKAMIHAMHSRRVARAAHYANLFKVVHAAEVSISRIEGTSQPDVTSQTTINVLSMPEWTQARTVIMQALAGYPDARIAVADALAQVEAPDAAH